MPHILDISTVQYDLFMYFRFCRAYIYLFVNENANIFCTQNFYFIYLINRCPSKLVGFSLKLFPHAKCRVDWSINIFWNRLPKINLYSDLNTTFAGIRTQLIRTWLQVNMDRRADTHNYISFARREGRIHNIVGLGPKFLNTPNT